MKRTEHTPDIDWAERDGYHAVDGRAARIEEWRERKEARAFEVFCAALRRRLHDRGVCRFCSREISMVPGVDGSVLRYHYDASKRRCPGSGRSAVLEGPLPKI